jgi:hypothetical protein
MPIYSDKAFKSNDCKEKCLENKNIQALTDFIIENEDYVI